MVSEFCHKNKRFTRRKANDSRYICPIERGGRFLFLFSFSATRLVSVDSRIYSMVINRICTCVRDGLSFD